MKATMNKEDYRYFTESLVIIKEKTGIDIAHTVETVGDKFLIEILENIDVNKLDNLLDIDDELLYNTTQTNAKRR